MMVIPARTANVSGLRSTVLGLRSGPETGDPRVKTSHPWGRGRRHFIRAMTPKASVRSCEFNAVHEDNGRHVDPQQKDDDGGDGSLDEGELRIAGHVPREAV